MEKDKILEYSESLDFANSAIIVDSNFKKAYRIAIDNTIYWSCCSTYFNVFYSTQLKCPVLLNNSLENVLNILEKEGGIRKYYSARETDIPLAEYFAPHTLKCYTNSYYEQDEYCTPYRLLVANISYYYNKKIIIEMNPDIWEGEKFTKNRLFTEESDCKFIKNNKTGLCWRNPNISKEGLLLKFAKHYLTEKYDRMNTVAFSENKAESECESKTFHYHNCYWMIVKYKMTNAKFYYA